MKMKKNKYCFFGTILSNVRKNNCKSTPCVQKHEYAKSWIWAVCVCDFCCKNCCVHLWSGRILTVCDEVMCAPAHRSLDGAPVFVLWHLQGCW